MAAVKTVPELYATIRNKSRFVADFEAVQTPLKHLII